MTIHKHTNSQASAHPAFKALLATITIHSEVHEINTENATIKAISSSCSFYSNLKHRKITLGQNMAKPVHATYLAVLINCCNWSKTSKSSHFSNSFTANNAFRIY